MLKVNNFLSIAFLNLSAIFLVGLQIKPLSWIILGTGALITLLFCSKQFKKDIILIYISFAILGITPISTDISGQHLLIMGSLLFLMLAIPYCMSRFVYKDYLIRFQMHHRRTLYKKEILYIFISALIAYLFLPFMLRSTGSYQNWTLMLQTNYLAVFFIGMNLLGTWDDLFFVNITLGTLRRHIPFLIANTTQAILTTSFLYQLGFRGWAFFATFIFAFAQGVILKQTKSLSYLITIHLAVELILYLALIHAYYPDQMPIFLIK